MSVVSILVQGIDVTDDVIYADAYFATSVGAYPGEFTIRVKDPDHSYDFRAGNRVTLDVDGLRQFDGYALTASQLHAFAVEDTTDITKLTRLWTLAGPDINILFQKRFVYDQSNPNKAMPYFPPNSSDATVITDLVTNRLDLGGDNISFSGITSVGTPNPDSEGSITQIGSTWGEAMRNISSLTGAVWGLKPDRTFYYEDVDIETAPFVLSDEPNQSTSFGYGNMEILNDGTRLVNDLLLWGAGTGSPTAVYTRITDAPSVATHGRWQDPTNSWRYDLFRQTSVVKVANSIVYGSPQNLHGAKDDGVRITCKVRKAGLTAGDKVRFINSLFGIDKVYPVRKLKTTFASPTDALFEVELSYEIDDPLGYAEFLGFKFPGFNFNPPTFTWPQPEIGGCTDEMCGITDSFGRTVASGWGTSDAGLNWTSPGPASGTTYNIVGNRGHVLCTASTGVASRGAVSELALKPERVRFDFELGVDFPLPTAKFSTAQFALRSTHGFFVDFRTIDTNPGVITLRLTSGSTATSAPITLIAGTIYHVLWENEPGVGTRVKVYTGDEPGSWTLEHFNASSAFTTSAFAVTVQTSGSSQSPASSVGPFEVFFDNLQLEVNGVLINPCSQYASLDDFNRTGATWGTSSSGYVWTKQFTGSTTTNGSEGVLTGQNATGAAYTTGGVWASTEPWSMTARFKVGIQTNNSTLTFWVIDSGSSNYFLVTVKPQTNIGTQGLHLEQVHGGSLVGFSTQSRAFANGSWHLIRIESAPEYLRARVWSDSSTEPTSWDIETTVPKIAALTASTQRFRVSSGASPFPDSYTSLIDYIDFGYDGKPCYEGGPPPEADAPTTTVAAGAYGCETPTQLSVATYETSYAYIAGTTTLYVDGLLQRNGLDYQESSSNPKRLNFFAAVTGVVWVCYRAQGATPGGGQESLVL